VSPDAFTHVLEILDGADLYCSPEIFDDLMLLAREFGHNSLISSLVRQQDFPRREGKVHEFLQELDRSPRGTTIEAEFQSIRDAVADVQRRLSMIEERFDAEFETILSERDKTTELMKQPSQKRQTNQQICNDSLIEWIAAKSTSFRSVNRPLV
jgi:hypothetical protein